MELLGGRRLRPRPGGTACSSIAPSITCSITAIIFQGAGPLNVATSAKGPSGDRQAALPGGQGSPPRPQAVFAANARFRAQAFYADIKGPRRSPRPQSRHPGHARHLPGGPAGPEPKRRKFEGAAVADPPGRRPVAADSTLGGIDLSGYPLDGPLPDLPGLTDRRAGETADRSLARRENLTIASSICRSPAR